MMRIGTNVAALGAFCAAATTAWGQEETPAVPSGLILTLQEIREEQQPDGAVWMRMRYVAPGLTRDGYGLVEKDFAALCETQALALRTAAGDMPAQAIISIASAPVEFGMAAPDVTQFFEAFRLQDNTCIWEAF